VAMPLVWRLKHPLTSGANLRDIRGYLLMPDGP